MSFFDRYATNKPQCIRCKLDKSGCKTPRMQVAGEGKKGILLIGDVPREEDDKKGLPFSGEGGSHLRKELFNLRIKLDSDCWRYMAIGCRIPEDKTPTNKQIDACRPSLIGVLKKLKPKKIVLLGNTAIESFYGKRIDNKSVTKFAGLKFWDSVHNAWVFPVFDPSYVKGKEYDAGMIRYFRRTLRAMAEASDLPLVKTWKNVRKLVDFKEAAKYLSDIIKNHKTVALDWETTGIKPQIEGHKIATIGLANDEGAASIPVEHPHWTEKQQGRIKFLVANIVKSRRIKKIVHNLGFEYSWGRNIFKVSPHGFQFDTQLGTHIEDNRSGITGLKFQAFMRWGIEGYETIVDPYLKSAKGSQFNTVMKAPLEPLLQYNGEDALYTWELYKELQEVYDEDDQRAYKLLHNGLLVLAEMHCNGINIEQQYYTEEKKRLEEKRKEILKDIGALEETLAFRKKYGRSFDMASNDDMQDILFEVMKLKPIKETKTGYSVDEDVLKKIDVPLTQMVLRVRKISKLISTYIDGFMREGAAGFMHPWFHLHRARTYRSSSSRPNFQNVPKRDKEAKMAIRSGMVPFLFGILSEADFSGAEIATSCFYHKDPTFIKYQLDKEGGSDMHRDACSEIWKVDRDLITKPIRQETKGGFVFAEFYGSYYKDCARLMWNTMRSMKLSNGVTLRQHAKTVGLNTYAKFEAHVKKFEDKFWNEWFPVYKQWKLDVYQEYLDTGMVKTLLGFKFKGYMDKKQCSNYPVQGTSFHLLIATLIKVNQAIKKARKNTKLIGQIHDSIVANVPPLELKWYRHTLRRIISNLDKTYKWMNVPMDVELEISKVYHRGGSFAHMTEIPI